MSRKIISLLLVVGFLAGCQDNANTENTEKTAEKPANNDITKVVTIDDQTLEKEDLDFHMLLNKIRYILKAEQEEAPSDFDEQLAYYDNINVNLQSMIELHAMTLLAEE